MSNKNRNRAQPRVVPKKKQVEDPQQETAQAEEEAEEEESDAETVEDTEQQDGDDADTGDGGEAEEDGDADADMAEDTTDDAQGESPAAEPGLKATQATPKAKTPASGAAKPAAQAGFAQRVGRESTKPAKPAKMAPPYLESPRDFGIHIKGHLVRFKKGRTSLAAGAYQPPYGVTLAQVLDALRKDSYVADNGAELME